MQCDICGKELPLVRASIEGVVLNACKACAQFGKEVMAPKIAIQKKAPNYAPKIEAPEPMQVIVKDFDRKIKDARESIGLKQEDFAKKINEKLSLVHNIESGHFKPSIELARKVEKFLKIKLVDEYMDDTEGTKSKAEAGLTIGDVINVK